MTRDEMKELACLGFSRRSGDAELLPHRRLSQAGGPARPTPSCPTSWPPAAAWPCAPATASSTAGSTACCLPDTVGTGGDSHTRFPLGISFPAGSGLVAFAAAIGAMPLDMPESVLVKFTGSPATGRHPAGCGERHPLCGHPAGPAHGGQGGQEERLQRPHHGDRGAARSQAGAGLRAHRCHRRALLRRQHDQALAWKR